MQNSQIEISKTLLAIDPTLGMRALLKRDDIVAKRAGMVYLVSKCSPVEVEHVFYDHNINGTCYMDTPVKVQNQTWFIAPGMEKDLVKESVEIPCEDVTLGIYKDPEGQWKSQNGLSVVGNIPMTIIKKSERVNLILSAPPVYNKLENVENPFAYLATWTFTLFKVKENQKELMRNLRSEGSTFESIKDMLNEGFEGAKGIAGDIKDGIKEGAEIVKDNATSYLKNVTITIVTIATIIICVIITLKIYFVRRAAGIAISELVKITRKAPPSIQQMIRRWQPEVHNVMLKEDGATELDVFSIERSDSIVSMPQISLITLDLEPNITPRIEIQINQTKVYAILDTGANISLIAESLIRKITNPENIEKINKFAKTANNTYLKIVGKSKKVIKMGKIEIQTELFVTEDQALPELCILGSDVIETINKQNETVTLNIAEKYIMIGDNQLFFKEDNKEHLTEDDSEAGWSVKRLTEVQNMSPEIVKVKKLFWQEQATQKMKSKFYVIEETLHRIPKRKRQVPPVFIESGVESKELSRRLNWDCRTP
uniref:Peptidase A2 domain-containing protein n=1 Tax=Caenorhabditis tropicalis TaxID=1561998 RepID=A0A1I7TAL5_9PELO